MSSLFSSDSGSSSTTTTAKVSDPAPIADTSSYAVNEAAREQRLNAAARVGRRSTILTSTGSRLGSSGTGKEDLS